MLQFDEKQNAIIANGMTQCDKVEFSGKYMLPEGTDRLEIVVNDDCDWCVHIDNCDRDSICNIDIQYVHQLQNVLNILGIEMEVVV